MEEFTYGDNCKNGCANLLDAMLGAKSLCSETNNSLHGMEGK